MEKSIFTICGEPIRPGEHLSIKLPMPELYTFTPVDVPIHIINAKKPGPRLFICAAIHGNEIIGVEIIRRLLKLKSVRRLIKGTLIAIPIVNIYGFIHQSRYLPDRRDLNRNFPGLKKGSLTSRLAKLFLDEIVQKCTHGIDLHSGGIHRRNLPQIRINLDQKGTLSLAKAFGAPVILNANLRDGSIRQATNEMDIPLLVYEGGEALRFDEMAIRTGLRGIINVMRALGMIKTSKQKKVSRIQPTVARSSLWVRAPRSGIFHSTKALGKRVEKGESLGMIGDPFGSEEINVVAPRKGVIIGQTTIPLINEGDALFHLAFFKQSKAILSDIEKQLRLTEETIDIE